MRLTGVVGWIAGVALFSAWCGGCDSKSPPLVRLTLPHGVEDGGPMVAGGFALAAPSKLKLAASSDNAREITGADFESSLPHPYVIPAENQAHFSPYFVRPDGPFQLAYSYYRFAVLGHGGRLDLSLDWEAAQEWNDLWVGIADFSADRWVWHTIPDEQAIILEDVGDLLNGEDEMLVAVAVTGTAPWLLNGLALADYFDGRAALSVSPAAGVSPLEITLDAIDTANPQAVTSYEWDVWGDWQFVAGDGEPEYTTIVETGGTYHPQVRVTYDDGSISLAHSEYTVYGERTLSLIPDDTDPDWDGIDGTGTEHDPYELVVQTEPAKFSFIVLDQPGGEGEPLDPTELSWLVAASGETVAEWQSPGTLKPLSDGSCMVFARDDLGQESNLVHLEVRFNEPPVSIFSAAPLSGNAPLTVVFDAGDSYDPDYPGPGNGIEWLEWDFDGDGEYDLKEFFAFQKTGWTYHQPGIYQPVLRVTDRDGGWGTSSVEIEVLGDPADPYWHFTRAVGPVDWLDYIALENVAGRPALAFSYDSETDPGLAYLRADDEYGAEWGEPAVVHSYDVPFFASLDMSIINGNPAIAYITEEALELAQLRYIRAADSAGDTWAASTEIHENEWLGDLSLEQINGAPAVAIDLIDNMSGPDGVHYLYYDGISAPNGWSAPALIELLMDIGEYNPLLEVDGRPAVSYARYLDYYDQRPVFNRATNDTGSDWSSPVVLDSDDNAGAYSSLAIVDGNPAVAYLDREAQAIKYTRASDPQGTTWGSPLTVAADDGVHDPGLLTHLLATPSGPLALFESYVLVSGGMDSILRCATATDPLGAAWDPPATIWGQPGTMGLDAALVGGRPTVAVLMWGNEYGDEIWVGMYY